MNSSKSRSSQATSNSSTSIGVQGDNLGATIAGNGNNVTMTDHGLVNALVEIGGNMNEIGLAGFGAASDMAYSSAELADNAIANGFDYASGVNSDSLRLAENVNADSLGFANGVVDEFGNVINDSYNLVSDVMGGTGDLLSESMAYQNDITNRALTENADIASDSIAASEYALDASLQFGSSTFDSALNAVSESSAYMAAMAENSNNNATDLARDVMLFSGDAMNQNNDLALAFGQAVAEANETATGQIVNANKSALQFADNMSRSDGQQLAKDSNKTLMVSIVAISVAAGLYAISQGKR